MFFIPAVTALRSLQETYFTEFLAMRAMQSRASVPGKNSVYSIRKSGQPVSRRDEATLYSRFFSPFMIPVQNLALSFFQSTALRASARGLFLTAQACRQSQINGFFAYIPLAPVIGAQRAEENYGAERLKRPRPPFPGQAFYLARYAAYQFRRYAGVV
jgi:hypothetical protein